MADSKPPPPPTYRSPANTQLTSRRVSFRMSLADPALPPDYLDALEQKRKQLDESIHKYIASKEREYKVFERDLKAQFKAQGRSIPDAELSNGSHDPKRRTSSESTAQSALEDGAERNVALQQSLRSTPAVGALLQNGQRRDSEVIEEDVEGRAEIAGLTDRRASVDRDKEFVGLFTPPFLPALTEREGETELEHIESAPTVAPSEKKSSLQVPASETHKRAMSDSVVQNAALAKGKRPVQLQGNSRTSSSGSSADGRLISSLKSPAQKDKPKRKRVSLAVGDTIVAPSDNVPTSMESPSHAPSHSRTRPVQKPEKELVVSSHESTLDAQPPDMPSALRVAQIMGPPSPNESPSSSFIPGANFASFAGAMDTASSTTKNVNGASLLTPPKPKSKIDADGDLFDLEEDSDGELMSHENKTLHNHSESDIEDEDEDDLENDEVDDSLPNPKNATPIQNNIDSSTHESYSPTAGILTENGSSPSPPSTATASDVRLEFHPSSSLASRQPTNPGFRRPSVHMDPTFQGAGYAAAELRAANDEIYGSKYVAQDAKGSFNAGVGVGSLGESFMERNAAEMMRRRAGGPGHRRLNSQEVKS